MREHVVELLLCKAQPYRQAAGITDASVRVCITDHEAWQLRYDDLKNYSNERSLYLAQLRDSIEGPWQGWELSQIDVDALKALSLDEVRCEAWPSPCCLAGVGTVSG